MSRRVDRWIERKQLGLGCPRLPALLVGEAQSIGRRCDKLQVLSPSLTCTIQLVPAAGGVSPSSSCFKTSRDLSMSKFTESVHVPKSR